MQIWKKIIPAMAVAAGTVLLSYPFISNWMYAKETQSEADAYLAEVSENDSGDENEEILAEAREYNEQIANATITLTDPFVEDLNGNEVDDYYSILNPNGTGVMCFIEIPKISVYLPVYHGTEDDVLSKGAGHVQGSAFPTGDVGMRPIISAHTGLSSAKMFTDLTELEEGDLFFLHVLDETFAYEVCEIDVILPEDVSALTPEEGRDLVTLLTCTPYGINTHRLVVTGERVDYEEGMEEDVEQTQEVSQWMLPYRKALIGSICAWAAFMIIFWIPSGLKNRRRKQIDAVRYKRR